MSKLLRKKPPQLQDPAAPAAADSDSAAAAANPTSVAYMRVLKDYSLLMEYKRLKQQSPTGVYVLPAAETLRRWYGVIFVRKGHYRGGVFKFVLLIPDLYPDEGPKVYFLSEVFHPLIHPDTGLLDLSLQFPVWSSHQHFIVLLLCYIKKIFYATEWWERRPGREAMNPKAQALWHRSKEEYMQLCEKNTAKSTSAEKLYGGGAGGKGGAGEDRMNPIVFERPRPVHEEAYRRIVRQDKEKGLAGNSYLDWFTDGVYKLDNNLGPAPSSLPPASFQPAAASQMSLTAAAAQGAQLLGLMSPLSPLVQKEDEEDTATKTDTDAAAAGEGDSAEGDSSGLTVAQLASL